VTTALFIPLNGEHFDAFERGEKHTEYRLYGSRWNERTCQLGRAVTLSRGYGKRRRLQGVVTSFRVEPFKFGDAALMGCYPKAPKDAKIACIGVRIADRTHP